MIKKRVAILISGRGSNMMALVEAANAPGYPAEIVMVISNRPDAAGLVWAKERGIPALGLDHKRYESREHFEGQMQSALELAKVDIVCCAGFMRLMTAGFVDKWRDRMLNIHPSLLPSFKRSSYACARAGGRRQDRWLHCASGAFRDGRGTYPRSGCGARPRRRHRRYFGGSHP